MVEHPIDYPWSSYRVNAGKITRHQLVMHDIYVVWVMTIALVIMPIVSCFQSI
jgi:hypothetical protein